jgi:hypothetical protein
METKVKNESLVKINASDYGLESTKAQEIEAMFLPMLDKMKLLEKEYNKILKLEVTPETCQAAKELRLQYVKVRTGTADIHKTLKEFYLKGGRFIDGWKNAQLAASQGIEESLKNIENHYEILEAERLAALKEERRLLILPYTQTPEFFVLETMTDEAFKLFLSGLKTQYDAQIAAEKQAETDRIAKEKADADAREQQRLENIKLKEEAIERERLAEIERKKQADILAKERAKSEADRKERERLEAEIEKKKQADIKAKRDEDVRIENEKKAKAKADKKARLAPDKTKLMDFAQVLNDLPRPEVTSLESKEIATNVNTMLVKISNYIKENAEKL